MRRGAPLREEEDDDAAFADDVKHEAQEQVEDQEEQMDLTSLPENWQDFVASRLESAKLKTRKKDSDDRKTLDEVFDQQTLLILYKFISNGHIETLDYPISTGKEANVFKATTPQGGAIAVKIFRTNTATFRSFMTYIAGDPRFGHVRPNRRDIVYVWAQKEYKNLQRYFEAGVRVPQPIAWKQNVLIMEFIGDDQGPALRLKDHPPEDAAKAYETLVTQYKAGVDEGRLVHGDFSEFNILHHQGEFVVIDVAQAVLTEHPMAKELLVRDSRNLAAYFRRQGVKTTPEETLKRLTPKPRPKKEDDEEAE